MAWISILIMLRVLSGNAYPVRYTSCGIEHELSRSPRRVVTLNQGATEFMLALGLADKMAGTAYLDDYIWPRYATDYVKIPVLSSAYPNETTIMSVSPDFIVASYQSAFRQMYNDPKKGPKGIFNTTVAKCVGEGSEWDGNDKPTCRPQLHSQGIGTYLMADACEDSSLRPVAVSEQTVYEEMRALGGIFKVDVEPMIKEMREDFDGAQQMVASAMHGDPLKAIWIDCVGRCCPVDEGQEPQVFVGAGSGVPNLLMQRAGLSNVFKNVEGNWACVNESKVISANPDVIIVVDASWDTAISKLQWLYGKKELCEVDALKGARFVQIPFSATTLSPRNGPAAHDLAMAAIHVRLGSLTATLESGVGSFSPHQLEVHTQGLTCHMWKEYVVYSDSDSASEAGDQAKDDTDDDDGDKLALGLGLGIGGAFLVMAFCVCVCLLIRSRRKPSSAPNNGEPTFVIGQPVTAEGAKC
mmetsp:Transcript_12593/g.23737  ORF Transcript_12593/g.23737 Transcript_12593/m.23737 type:complete len:469 (-) Transcript_12593:235-1641(-)